MKHDIIKTENYLFVVDESEIKEGDWVFNAYQKQTYRFNAGSGVGLCKKIIAHLPLNGSPILEGVDLLPPLEEKDEKSMFANEIENILEYDRGRWYGRIEGYNKAKEKYKYTEEDVKNAIIRAYYLMGDKIDVGYFDEIIQSLSQPKMPIGFECEIEDKIALDGHTIIGTEPITTTTPEGHTQWVGTYIFN